MKIKDIVNRDLVNLENCESEPIHVPGSIQPHGFLVGMNENYLIDYCSANIQEHTSLSFEQLLGKNISVLTSNEASAQMIATAASSPKTPITVTINGTNFSCFVHKSNDTFIAEFEPAEMQALALSELYNLNLESMNALQNSDNLKVLSQRVAEQIKKLTGFDRVMIYRFDEQYNGEVFAEGRNEELEPFLGLHYPHTDIPAQARELYIRNLLRVIVDVDYTPAALFTIDDVPNKNLDLSMASLRSVSPIHVEYLQNIGVRATLTISLIHEGKLWGLVACHHYTGPKFLSAYTRVTAQLSAQMLTSQIQVREVAEEYAIAKRVNASVDKLLIEPNEQNRDSFHAIVGRPELLSLCNASGVAIVFGDKIYTTGRVPSDEEINTIVKEIRPIAKQGTFNTSKLADHIPGTETLCEIASGILYHAFDDIDEDCIVWFRGESLQEVNWAGDPEKAIIKNEKGLSPRNSFALWKQVIKCRSNTWAKPELSAAATYTHALQKHIHLLLLSEEELKYRQLSVQLKQANDELENINWISTHDLREPLRKIQIFSSRILSSEESELSNLAVESIKKMNESANRMQKLIGDITSYAKLRHTKDLHLSVDLNKVFAEALSALKNEIEETNATVTAEHLPALKGIELLFQQLFVNLIGNAIKFRKKDTPPVIRVTYQPGVTYQPEVNAEKLFHKISITDNGIGLNNEYRETIFRVFARLHNQEVYGGSGIGLALCKQIMQIHQGAIEADGKVDEGSVFTLYFPE